MTALATKTATSVLPSVVTVGAVENNNLVVLESSQDGVTAHAGGGQANGVLITANVVNVTTVATAADSLRLPPAISGVDIVVHNSAALNSMNVFPATGETINGGAANAALAIGAGKSTTFTCLTNGAWITTPRVPS